MRLLLFFISIGLELALHYSDILLSAAEDKREKLGLPPVSLLSSNHPHLLLQSPSSFFSFFDEAVDSGVRTPGKSARCPADSDACRIPHSLDLPGKSEKDDGHADVSRKIGSPKVSLGHAPDIPKLPFLQQQKARSSNRPVEHAEAVKKAIKEAFYAYPVYEGDGYKVHIHKHGQKDLFKTIHEAGAFNLNSNKPADDQWSWIQTYTQEYLQSDDNTTNKKKKGAKSAIPQTISLLQEELDRRCQQTLGLPGEALSRYISGDVYCVPLRDVNLKEEGSCIDSCLKPFPCPGKPSDNATKTALDVDVMRTLKEMCKASEVQGLADKQFCGEASVLRVTEDNKWVCLQRGTEMALTNDLKCYSTCGHLVPCLSPTTPIVLEGEAEKAKEFVDKNVPKFCTCDELETGENYKGCQTTTRSGKTCQNWSVQTPHQHTVLQDENHNYCRAAGGASRIWCFTTDPNARSDYCQPLGPKTQGLRRLEVFDVLLEGDFGKPHYILSFHQLPDSAAEPCRTTTPTNHIVPQSSISTEQSQPYRLKKSSKLFLLWKNVKVSNQADGVYAICLCDFTFFVHETNSCSQGEHFNVHAGWVHVKGPDNRGLELNTVTGVSNNASITGVGFTPGDRIVIVQDKYSCDVAASGLSKIFNAIMQGVTNEWSFLHNALGLHKAIGAILEPTNLTATDITLPSFTLYKTGRYNICWNSVDNINTSSAGIVNVQGVELQQEFNAFYVTSSAQPAERPFPIFIEARGEVETPLARDVFMAEVASPPCSGTVVGMPTDIRLHAASMDATRKVFVAEQIKIPKLSGTSLELCWNRNSKAIALGYVRVMPYLDFPLKNLEVAAFGALGAPKNVFQLSVDQFSVLGLHLSTAYKDYFVEKDLINSFTQGEFPKAVSFWVDDTGISVWYSTMTRPEPKPILKFAIKNVLAVGVQTNQTNAVFYIARGHPGRIEKYNMNSPADFVNLTPPATTKDVVSLKNPCDVALLVARETLVLAVDSISQQVLMFDADLNLIEAKEKWSGMSRPMKEPKRISCIKTPNTDEAEELFDCYITDPGNQRLVLIQYNAAARSSSFITEISSSQAAEQLLVYPEIVVAYHYKGFTLIYVAESGQKQPLFLTKSDDQDEIRIYGRLQATSNKELDVQAMCVLPTGDSANEALNHVWLVTFHNTFDGPNMHAVPLDTTATVPEFKYIPRAWYTVGEEHEMNPFIISEGSSNHGFSGFSLNTLAKNYEFIERNLTLNNKTGKINLAVSEIPESTVTVEVIGAGIVNSVNTSFSFRVFCRNGQYYRGGMCILCAAGTFNNITLARTNPAAHFNTCKACGKNKTTIAEGSTSEEQCLCEKGYHIDEENGGTECTPCPAGWYKDVIANTGCSGGGCPQFSVSHVEGAISAEDRKCSCLPGFYAVYEEETLQCVGAEVGFYSRGGYKAQKIECPPFTSTNPQVELGTDLSHCLCKPGYTPASRADLADPKSPASQLKNWIKQNNNYAELADSQVCLPCGNRFYKDTISANKCTACPAHSFSRSLSPTNARSCDMCDPGYYLTTSEKIPCGECQANSFCVGSLPTVDGLDDFAGDKTSCPDGTATMKPYANNTHPLSCMCTPGHEFQGFDPHTKKSLCRPAPLGIYKESLGNVKGVQCPPGSTTLFTGSKSLEECVCRPGYYLKETSRECTPCPIGAYCLGGLMPGTTKHMQFVSCPENTTTKGEMSVSLDDCLCGKGYYRSSANTSVEGYTCIQCRVNFYKDWTGNEACRQCSVNSGTTGKGSTSAMQCLCQPGYYYNSGLEECVPCNHAFKYCPGGEMDCNEDDTDCVDGKKPRQPIDCPINTRITEGFDTPSSLNDCKCAKGYSFNNMDIALKTKTCLPCNAGSYKSTVQDINCNGLCGVASTSLAGAQDQAQCFCEEGTYYAANACHVCPGGAICKGGLSATALEALTLDSSYIAITNEDHIKPYPQAGYYLKKKREILESTSDWHFIKCPIANSCLENGVCSPTMTNYLCSECKQGYTNGFDANTICTACPKAVQNALFLFSYQIGSLLFNIGMAHMNVAAGFNRRSIHSIVIKIASNFLTCMSVLSVVDQSQIELPSWLTNITDAVTETMTVKPGSTRLTSADCLIRDNFSLSFADTFFYTMLYYALLPVMLPIVVTFIMFFLVRRFKYYYRNSIKNKLCLLDATEKYGLTSLAEELREKYEEDRILMMFRYIPIPGDSRWRRIAKFVEDMIPIYVTVLFFLHTSTTRKMLSLLDCTTIQSGTTHESKSYLKAAMSVECKLTLSSEYFKFFALGIGGIALWSIGIPLGAFLVLYVNRKNLNSREARLKYGFLHNGFVQKYWYWETVVFARKLCVLVVSSVVVNSDSGTNGYRLWPASITAIVFNIYHLTSQPFDKRNYSTLDNLENHSMAIWTITVCIVLAMSGAGFSGNVNLTLGIALSLACVLFAFEVGINLLYAYFDSVRANRTFFWVPIIGYLFRAFARWAEKRKSWEPIVVYDVDNDAIQLIAAKRQRKLQLSKQKYAKRIRSKQRNYFLKVMAESLGFAVVHMKLDVIPGTFLEFVLRLGFSFHKVDEEMKTDDKNLQAIAGGDITMLAAWPLRQKDKIQSMSEAITRKVSKQEPMDGIFKKLEACITMKKSKNRIDKERVRDLEGGESETEPEEDEEEEKEEEEQEKDSGETTAEDEDEDKDKDEEIEPDSAAQKLRQHLSEEEQREAHYICDDEVMKSGIPLSELYLALLKLQLKDAMSVSQQYEVFKAKKEAQLAQSMKLLSTKNKKLKLIRYALQACSEGGDVDIGAVGLTAEAQSAVKAHLQTLQEEQEVLKARLAKLREDPDSYVEGSSDLEWLEGAGESKEAVQTPEQTPENSPRLSELSESEEEESAAENRQNNIFGFDAEDWMD